MSVHGFVLVTRHNMTSNTFCRCLVSILPHCLRLPGPIYWTKVVLIHRNIKHGQKETDHESLKNTLWQIVYKKHEASHKLRWTFIFLVLCLVAVPCMAWEPCFIINIIQASFRFQRFCFSRSYFQWIFTNYIAKLCGRNHSSWPVIISSFLMSTYIDHKQGTVTFSRSLKYFIA